MTSVEERIARVETRLDGINGDVAEMRQDLAKVASYVDELRLRRATWVPVENTLGRVLIAVLIAAAVSVAALIGEWVQIVAGLP